MLSNESKFILGGCALIDTYLHVYVLIVCFKRIVAKETEERGGLVVNASDSGSRGRGFEPHSGQTMLCP